MKTFLAVVGVIAILGAAGGLILAWSGAYNVAATTPEGGIVDNFLGKVADKSALRHSAGIQAPPLNDPAQIQLGFEHYQEMCVTCHGAPGVKASEIGMGLNPAPPDLVDSAKELSPARIYWIVHNGIKMTGMPAFGPTHEQREEWAIVAFVKQLPQITPEKYRGMVQAAVAGGEHHEEPAAPKQ
ncbi:MAG TPA: cytochrome c [Thermoanaerobaculia bacterium]|nr:cytochrome c [Thermoanaerobaculia bacterium]